MSGYSADDHMKKLPSIAIVAFVLTCVLAASLIERSVRRHSPRQAETSVSAVAARESPLVVFTTVALGGFRGLVIDILWTRIAYLQETGDYVEIAQLSDWVTRLDTRLPVVWDYSSFNMAYNVSAMFADPADRWRWVSKGIRMLRDEALQYNPEQVVLYDRLCRIYRHKLVESSDPAQPYFRHAWAKEMNEAFCGQGLKPGDIEISPATAARLRQEYKLQPSVMLDIDRQYGPFDWRLPDPHVIYWATLGSKAEQRKTDIVFDSMICESMAETVLRGRTVDFDPDGNELATDVRPDSLPHALATFEATASRHNLKLDSHSGLGVSYRNFLREALVAFNRKGHAAEANRVFQILRDDLHDFGTERPMVDYVNTIMNSPKISDPVEAARRQINQRHQHDE